jgi:hypothetical protein
MRTRPRLELPKFVRCATTLDESSPFGPVTMTERGDGLVGCQVPSRSGFIHDGITRPEDSGSIPKCSPTHVRDDCTLP